MVKKQAKKQKHKRYESAVGQDPSFTWIKRGWRTSEMQSIRKRGTWGTWCFFTALQWESMGVLQKPCSCSERTGATCMFGNLHIIVICYHIFTFYAKAPCDHNKKVLPTLKKCQLYSVLIQLTPSKEQSEMPTLCNATSPWEEGIVGFPTDTNSTVETRCLS